MTSTSFAIVTLPCAIVNVVLVTFFCTVPIIETCWPK